MVDTISLDDIQRACDILYRNPELIQTPLLSHVQRMFPSLDQDMDLYLKLENMQTIGEFTILSHYMYALPNSASSANESIYILIDKLYISVRLRNRITC